MRKEKVVKLIVSAVAAAYVAVVPVQAKDDGEGSAEGNVAEESAAKENGAGYKDSEESGADGSGAGENGEEEWYADESGAGEEAVGENGAEYKDTGNFGEEEGREGSGPDGCRDADSGITEEDRRYEGTDGTNEASAGTPQGEPGEDEAQYAAMGELSGEELVKEMSAVERIIWRKANYGPHMLSVKKEEEPEPEPEPAAYSEEDLYVLAHAICGEGQGYPDEEQLYIGSVILNRRSHGAYPDSIRGVVFQRGQYACTRDGNYYREPTEANWRNARWLLENGSILPANVVYQAGFRQGSGLYVQTRYHKYCYR